MNSILGINVVLRRISKRRERRTIGRWLALVVGCCVLWTADAASGELPERILGLAEPYRTIEVAAGESGVIAEIAVREGERVTRGQLLAKLDNELHAVLLSIAKEGMQAEGRLRSARAEWQLRKDRSENFAAVFAEGHARPEEMKRAQTDLAIAEAQLLTVREDLALKRLDYKKIQSQIKRRTVRAPIDGVVSWLHKDEGEFVAPTDPAVLTLVQLDPLLAVFSLTGGQANQLGVGQEVRVHFLHSEKATPATVEFIAPVTDGESGTVLVKIRVENPQGTYRSGTRCELRWPGSDEAPSK